MSRAFNNTKQAELFGRPDIWNLLNSPWWRVEIGKAPENELVLPNGSIIVCADSSWAKKTKS